MMRVIPNSGIMGEDVLDNLRADAVQAARETPIPEAVALYVESLERRYADQQNERRRQSMRDIGWTRKEPTHDQ